MGAATGLAELFGRRRFAIRPGTGRIAALLGRLGHPEQQFCAIHLVGTNGKGSTAAFLSAILTAAGQRTGLFTSPHLVNYAERFRVDGNDIPATELGRLIQQVLAAAAPEDTFFELTTALACCWFAEAGVRLAVLEAGMGGRADATAAITAEATVITPISLDHQQWLGNTLDAIAAEKVAIAEPGTPVICAPQRPEVREVISRFCDSNRNQLFMAAQHFRAAWEADGSLCYHGCTGSIDGIRPGIPGRYQCWNAACALATAELLGTRGITMDRDALRHGIAQASWPGRMERFALPGDVELLLDGAHNPDGAAALAESLISDWQGRRISMVLGAMADKELAGLLQHLLPLADRLFCVAPDQERALDASQLARLCAEQGYRASAAGTVAQGLQQAQAGAAPGDLIVVAGSLFVVGEVRALLTGQCCSAVRG